MNFTGKATVHEIGDTEVQTMAEEKVKYRSKVGAYITINNPER
jgi:hypothetical protein